MMTFPDDETSEICIIIIEARIVGVHVTRLFDIRIENSFIPDKRTIRKFPSQIPDVNIKHAFQIVPKT